MQLVCNIRWRKFILNVESVVRCFSTQMIVINWQHCRDCLSLGVNKHIYWQWVTKNNLMKLSRWSRSILSRFTNTIFWLYTLRGKGVCFASGVSKKHFRICRETEKWKQGAHSILARERKPHHTARERRHSNSFIILGRNEETTISN